jgi:hypothetical protein
MGKNWKRYLGRKNNHNLFLKEKRQFLHRKIAEIAKKWSS